MDEPQAKLLVVDEEVRDKKLLETWLAPRGYCVSRVTTGQEALARVHQERPDLILFNIMPPALDGLAACQKLKADPETCSIPVVIMTTPNDRAEWSKGIAACAADFVTHPVDCDELLARIDTSLRMKQAFERKLESLVKVNQLLASTLETEELWRVVLAAANRLFSAEGSSIALIDKQAAHLEFVLSVGGAKVEHFRLPLGHGIIGWVARTGQSVACNDTARDSRFSSMVDRKLGFQTKSILCAPLKHQDRTIGAIEVVNSIHPSGFTQEDLQILTAFAGLAATAVDRVREFTTARNTTQALQEVVQERYRLVGGNSPAIQEALHLTRKVAPSRTTVLLLGESGTGKEVFARAIHRWSPRADQPFVAVNCTALTQELLESELFGYEKGAFTGANTQKKGKFELAEGGTIFLDEIGDLAPHLQAKLLRVLQEREFQRVGGVKDIRTDARIVAATNRDLRLAVQQGTFREDLYYRLNVVALTLPPLRERPEDIPLLVQHFLTHYSQEMKRSRLDIAPDALELLLTYSWPGNVRELQNTIERAVVLSPYSILTVADLPTEIRCSAPQATSTENTRLNGPEVRPLAEAMDAFQRALVRKALEQARDCQTEAARLLHIPQPSLSRLMKRLGLR